jgi:hypothetical protein
MEPITKYRLALALIATKYTDLIVWRQGINWRFIDCPTEAIAKQVLDILTNAGFETRGYTTPDSWPISNPHNEYTVTYR